jgi:hypothetical protein
MLITAIVSEVESTVEQLEYTGNGIVGIIGAIVSQQNPPTSLCSELLVRLTHH